MSESRVTEWRPTPDEVARIVDEMRPIIRAFAQRAQAGQRGREMSTELTSLRAR